MEAVLNNYINASTNEPYKNHPIANLIRNELPKCFRSYAPSYNIKGSSGIGRWAIVPWISFLNENITTTPQDGYYVVYLFKEDMTGFYLSLNFGAREFNRIYGRKNLSKAAEIFRNILHEKFSDISDYVPMDLGSRDGITKRPNTIDYENGNIFSIEYSINDLPSDDKLINDLNFMLKLYDYLYDVRRNTIFLKEDLIFLDSPTGMIMIKPEKLEDSVNLFIENFGAIRKADINLGKINVIGGKNSTGKSTASKLLFCFLKYNSFYRKDFAYKSVMEEIEFLISMIRRDSFKLFSADFNKVLRNKEFEFRHASETYQKLESYSSLKELFYETVFSSNYPQERMDKLFEYFDRIDEYINFIEEDGNDLYNSIMTALLDSEFKDEMKGVSEFYGNYNNAKFKFSSNFNNHYKFDCIGEFFVNDVFYIDSFSWLDLNERNSLVNTAHADSIRDAIKKEFAKPLDVLDDVKYGNIIKMEKDIKSIINGELKIVDGELKFLSDDGVLTSMNNTASGIKQIALIQLFLRARLLKHNSVLILDEPEVNLHPEWQVKFAEIIVLLARRLDIKIYLNTHSPMIIEAILLYSERCRLLKDTNVYLTEKHKLGGYYFKQIYKGQMSEVYRNLSEPYNLLDKVRSDILHKRWC